MRVGRSRSPRRGAAASAEYQQIMDLVAEREQARAANDWTRADELREELRGMGVTLYDKNANWRASDGTSGKIPKWSDILAAQSTMAEVKENVVKDEVPQPTEEDETRRQINQLVQAREQARSKRDWDEADRLRQHLDQMGVELFDKEKTWKTKSGAVGIIVGYLANGPSDVEVNTLVLQREKARQNSDYETADMIRAELKRHGVDISDQEKVWRCTDGRFGRVPRWDSIIGGDAGAVVSRAMPLPVVEPMRPRMPAQMTIPTDNLVTSAQNELVQIALQAAQDPATAARALQALKDAGIGRPIVGPSTGRRQEKIPIVKPHPPPQPQAAAATVGSEVEECLDYLRQWEEAPVPPTDEDVKWAILVREKARKSKDYKSADELRDVMRKTLSLEIHDQQKRWSLPDGRHGEIPSWE